MDPVVEFKNIKKYFWRRKGLFGVSSSPVKAVDGVSFEVEKGSTFGLVGESGSGKSTIAKILTGILKPDSGDSAINGRVDMVFQDPYSSLNPRMTVRDILGEPLLVRGWKKDDIAGETKKALDMVKLNNVSFLVRYPHQFSGGERQRIAIARALITRPDVIILDEPVSSLDVSIQAGILNLLLDIQEEMDLTYVFISHDLRVVEFMSDTVGVMVSGKLAEIASSEEIYSNPKSEYTKKLLAAVPSF